MKKKITAILTASIMALSMAACGGSVAQSGTQEPAAEPASTASAVTESKGAESKADSTGVESAAAESAAVESAVAEVQPGEETEIQVFIAASLNTVMQEVAAAFNEQYPNVKITYNADSSGTLLTQIEEGYACDVFFSAAQKQMNKLQDEDGLVVEGTRANVVNNQVVVVTRKDSGTTVTGLSDIANASSMALADGSVPVGRYTRVAMINAGLLPGYEVDAASDITTQQVSDALGGVEISEQGNVSKVLAAVVEASCEVGTTYYSDTYGYEDQLDILETVGYDLTGDVIYPIAQVVNEEADEAEKTAAAEFVKFVTSDEAKAIFEAYYFDTNVG
jgi:molybdate transport system substrate-binding protein